MPTAATIQSEQTFQVGVTGPGDIRKMHVVSGLAQAGLTALASNAGGNVTVQRTFAAAVGPTLTAAEYRRSTAVVALTALNLTESGGAFASWAITDVDADLDDETGRVKLQFDLQVTIQTPAATMSTVAIAGVSFQIFILTI